jgi:hypothetical protein
MITRGTWYLDVIDDTSRFNLPRGPIYQIMATVAGIGATIATVEEYQEVGYPIDRAADATLLAHAPETLMALELLIHEYEQRFIRKGGDAPSALKQARLAASEARTVTYVKPEAKDVDRAA